MRNGNSGGLSPGIRARSTEQAKSELNVNIATTEPDSRAAVRFPFDNTYARLPHRFYARLAPKPVAAPALIRVNRPLAALLGLDPDALASSEGISVLAGNQVPEGAHPIALAYAGHQFGNFVPQLGDGRAILLGEVGSGSSPLRRPAQGLGRDALFPERRRARSTWAGVARISCQRGDGSPRRTDHALVRRGDHG